MGSVHVILVIVGPGRGRHGEYDWKSPRKKERRTVRKRWPFGLRGRI